MKLFKSVLKLFFSIILGLMPATIFVAIGLLVYNENRNGMGIFFLTLFSVVAVVVAYLVAKQVFNRGSYTLVRSVRASPDFDKMVPVTSDRVRSVTPVDYVENYMQKNNFINKATVCIWGQKLNKDLIVYYTINTVAYDSNLNCLSVFFHDNSSVYIWDPGLIIEAHDFMKIINASRIRWEWLDKKTGCRNYCEYTKNRRKIAVLSNAKVSTDALSLAMPAFLFSKF